MLQLYHPNAVTNFHIRSEIKRNPHLSYRLQAKKYNVSTMTIRRWRNREDLSDKTSRPHKISYSLSDELETLAVSIRKTAWFSLDEIHEMIMDKYPSVSRSSLYRAFKRNKVNTLPQGQKDKSKKFKEYEPGFLHVDVTYLPRIKGQKLYLFVAIDRATRLLFFKVYDKKTADNAQRFFEECLAFFPFEITHILTDNGLEFSNRLLKSKKGDVCKKASLFDDKCKKNNIEHRLTRPATPKTNGMVERVNGIIKSSTVAKIEFQSREELERELNKFQSYYNTMRRHGGLRKELGVKTPLEALEKWYNINPKIFKQSYCQLNNFILFLNPYCNQPGET